jgi:Putative nucleotidyltransferase DUF294
MDVKHMLSAPAANIMLLSQAEQMRQGAYVQRVTVQQSLSAPLTVLFHAWCWIAVGSEGRGEQTLGTEQDKEGLHQARRLQDRLALDLALSATRQYEITDWRGLYRLPAHARWLWRR